MKKVPKLLIERPLVAILVSIILGNIIYSIYIDSLLGAVIFTVPFIIVLIFFIDRNTCILLSLFLFISFWNCNIYYGIRENKKGVYSVRITKINKDIVTGNLRGRKVTIRNRNYDIKEGQLIILKGKFKKVIDVNSGVVGEIFIKDMLFMKEDFKYKIKNLSKVYFGKIKHYVGENQGALLTSLFFGDKDNLKYEQRDNLSEIGVIHLICISGMHLALIFQLINKIFNVKIAILICVLYVILVGSPPSAVRALIMITMLNLSKKVFKTYEPISALSLSAIILIMFKPYNLWDIGFALSYLATLGIILFNKTLIRTFYRLPIWLNNYLALSLSAQALTYPYMIIVFNKFSINFIIAGFIITPIITIMFPLALLTFVFINISSILELILIPVKIFMTILNGQLYFLNKIIISTIYISEVYAIAYLIMLLSFYMSCKGFNKFRKALYAVIPSLLISSFTFGTKIKFVEEKWNKALVIEKGFNKIAIVNKKNDFFSKSLKQKKGVDNIYQIKESQLIKIGNKALLYFDNKLENVYLMSTNREYDIINLKECEDNYIKIYNHGIR